MEWPEKVSSTRAFRMPVAFHCATNSFCERRATSTVMTIVSGIVTSAITASSGEMMNIITSTPTTVSSEITTCDSVCCIDWPMLSTSFVTRLSSSPRCTLSKYDSGRRWILSSTCLRRRSMARCTMPLRSRACSQLNRLANT